MTTIYRLEHVFLAVVATAAFDKFFGSRRLRASPQGSSPWTSLSLRFRHPTHVVSCPTWRNVETAQTKVRRRVLWNWRNRGPGRGALGRRPQATTAKKTLFNALKMRGEWP